MPTISEVASGTIIELLGKPHWGHMNYRAAYVIRAVIRDSNNRSAEFLIPAHTDFKIDHTDAGLEFKIFGSDVLSIDREAVILNEDRTFGIVDPEKIYKCSDFRVAAKVGDRVRINWREYGFRIVNFLDNNEHRRV